MRSPFRVRFFVALCVLAVSSGCTLTPPYERPAPAVPATWPEGDAYPAAAVEVPPQLGYRDLFLDPKLIALIERALSNNQDLRLALANVAAVRGQLRIQQAQLLPRVDAAASVGAGERSARAASGTGGGSQATSYEIGVGLTAFELDVFGRVRSLGDAALQEYLASEAAVRSVRLTLAAEVANVYLGAAANRSLLAIAQETAKLAERSVALTQARLKGGIVPRSDLRQAETILAQAQSDLASLTTISAQDRNALALLVGVPVTEADLAASIDDVGPALGELPAGLDSLVLLQRPDVLQAEHRLRAANARIGAARAAFFPRITLTAVAGLASTALSSLFTAGAFTWAVQPALSVPLFDAGANAGNLEATLALREAATASYQKSIQTAFREVADALARRGTIDAQLDAQARLEAAARDNFTLVDARYRQGVESYLGALDAQRSLYGAQRSHVEAKLIRARNLVDLYRVLGGQT